MNPWIEDQLKASLRSKEQALSDKTLLETFNNMCVAAVDAYRRGKKLLIAGNGGSAADAQHIAGELVSRFYFDRAPLAAVALTTDTSILTAIGNDYGYESLFSRQVEALGTEGDLFLAISTSGKSPNIIKAIQSAKTKNLKVFGFTGKSGGTMAHLCDLCACVPLEETPRIQEVHLLLGHTLCAYIEKQLFAS